MTESDLEFANKANIAAARRFKAERDELVKALENVIRDINDYERVNNLVPAPGRTECWDSVARAKKLLNERSTKELCR